jgi:hypothetical protein
MTGKLCQRGSSSQLYQPGCGRPESAGPIELREVRLEIDVEPAGAAFSREVDGTSDETRADAAMPAIRMDGSVEDRGMRAAISGDVHETDEPWAVIGAEIAKAPRQNCAEICRPGLSPDGEPELLQLGFGRSAIDLDRDHRWVSTFSAPVTVILPPGGSRVKYFTTPSSTIMAKRLQRSPIPFSLMSLSSPMALA